MNVEPPRILNIGQCQNDGPWMRRFFKEHLGAIVDNAGTATEAMAKAERHRYQLILINRELDRDHSSGLDLVPGLVALNPETPVMLVSDFEEAQAAAIEVGAARGFGKSELEAPETLERLREIVGSGLQD